MRSEGRIMPGWVMGCWCCWRVLLARLVCFALRAGNLRAARAWGLVAMQSCSPAPKLRLRFATEMPAVFACGVIDHCVKFAAQTQQTQRRLHFNSFPCNGSPSFCELFIEPRIKKRDRVVAFF